jgi:ABC-type bacteriocin/lantibiotic exporter with double-glycine peptidase domain
MRRLATWLVCMSLWAAAPAAEPPGVWLDVPFVKQEQNGCGAASIAMVMQYWQQRLGRAAQADAGQIQRQLFSPEAGGIYASGLERYLKEHGFRTFAFRGTWDDLRGHLLNGRPLIAALKTGADDRHYVVVAGLDWRENVVLKNDPAERKLLKQSRDSFEKEWKAAGNWILLAVPQPGEPGSLH